MTFHVKHVESLRTLIRDLEAPSKADLVALNGALDDARDRLDQRRRALRHARGAHLALAVLAALQQLLAADALEHVGVLQKQLSEDLVLAVEAAVEARELLELVNAGADGRLGKHRAIQRLALAVLVHVLGQACRGSVGLCTLHT